MCICSAYCLQFRLEKSIFFLSGQLVTLCVIGFGFGVQELTEKKSLLSESEMKCQNLQSALSRTEALIKVSSYMHADALVKVFDGRRRFCTPNTSKIP